MMASIGTSARAETTDYTTGTPWMDVDMDGNVTADTPTDLKDNFALWANKDAIVALTIGEGEFAAGNTVEMAKKTILDIKAMYHGEVPE